MTDAELRSAIATDGETRTRAEFQEIVLDGVSIPVRSVQRTDTSRFEGKVTFGDYTVDSDQLMSTWAQSTWVGGMLVADQIEGATDSRFRYARAWTMSPRQLTLPLATEAVTLGYTADPDNTINIIAALVVDIVGGGSGGGTGYHPWLWSDLATMPLGSRQEVIFAACGRQLSAVNTVTLAVTSLGDLDNMPANTGAWFDDGAGNLVLWVPQGLAGIQWYNPYTEAFGVQDATIPAIAVLAHDTRLFALTVESGSRGVLRHRPLDGPWDAATNPALKLPPDEVPRNLVEFFDRAGNPAVAVITTKQAWVYDAEADALTPLGLRYPFARKAGQASAMWRDDGLYVSSGLGINRISGAGVRTATGLDRDDGFPATAMAEDAASPTWGTAPAVWAMTGAENFLVAAVNGYSAGGTTHHELVGWNEAGWHHITGIDIPDPGAELVPSAVMVADALDTYQVVTGMRQFDLGTPDVTPALHITRIPEDFHAPRASLMDQPVRFASTGVFYSGWFDAGMRNFLKAWSQVEIYLRDPDDGTAAPPGTVTVFYRTEDAPDTWVELGTASAFGQNVLRLGVADGFSHGRVSRRIELKLAIAHADAGTATLHTTTPVIEAISLKFIKLAQYGSAWQVYVPLSGYDTWRGVGPTQIDAHLSRLTAEGASKGPFARMLHRRDADGEPAEYRVRVAQWQRAESTGDVPYGDGVANIIQVPIQDLDE